MCLAIARASLPSGMLKTVCCSAVTPSMTMSRSIRCITPPGDYRRSLSRLLALRPILTHGGHGGPMNLARLHEVIETYLAATASLA